MNTTKLLEGNCAIIAGNPYLQGVSENPVCIRAAKNGLKTAYFGAFWRNFQQIFSKLLTR